MEIRRDVFQAIADPVRRNIIDLLSQKKRTVKEIAENFDISRPAISKHIKILLECDLITVEQKGREHICEINSANLVPAFLWLEQYKKLWEARIDSFEDYVNNLNSNKHE